MEPTNRMTQEGFERLKSKLADLENELLQQGQNAGEAAGANCDWHDNPAYEYAIEQMRILSRRIADLKEKLHNAKIITVSNHNSQIDIGATVTILLDGEEELFTIVGDGEGDPMSNLLSYNSPLGSVLQGKQKNDEVIYPSPSGKMIAKILEIKW